MISLISGVRLLGLTLNPQVRGLTRQRVPPAPKPKTRIVTQQLEILADIAN